MSRKIEYKRGDRIECDMVFVSQTLADAPDGYIKGIASTPRTDLYGHKVLRGAFDESIKSKGLNGPTGIKLLGGHDPQKVVGNIKRLETVGDDLQIEAQFFLDVGFAKDLYTVSKHVGGLNFSVGFFIEDYEFVDDDEIENESDAWLLIKKGDLDEVSVVTFPAQRDAQMSYIKTATPTTLRELERSFVANGYVQSRSGAKRLIQVMRQNSHLLNSKETSEASIAEAIATPAHLGLDAPLLKPMHEYVARMKAVFGSG